MRLYDILENDRGQDCVPSSIAFVTGVPYEEVLGVAEDFGFGPGRGMNNHYIYHVLNHFGFKNEFRYDLTFHGPRRNKKTITWGAFLDLALKGTFLIYFSNHVVGYKDGYIDDVDNTSLRRKIQSVYEIVEIDK